MVKPSSTLRRAVSERSREIARDILSRLTGWAGPPYTGEVPRAFVDRLQDYEDHLRRLLIVEPAPTLDDLNSAISKHELAFNAARKDFLLLRAAAANDTDFQVKAEAVEAEGVAQVQRMCPLFDQVKARIAGDITEGHA